MKRPCSCEYAIGEKAPSSKARRTCWAIHIHGICAKVKSAVAAVTVIATCSPRARIVLNCDITDPYAGIVLLLAALGVRALIRRPNSVLTLLTIDRAVKPSPTMALKDLRNDPDVFDAGGVGNGGAFASDGESSGVSVLLEGSLLDFPDSQITAVSAI